MSKLFRQCCIGGVDLVPAVDGGGLHLPGEELSPSIGHPDNP